jgi:hypothetical protein
MQLRIWSRSAACAVAALALGSSEAQSAPTPLGAVVHSVNRAAPNAAFSNPPGSPLRGEVFSASDVRIVVVSCGSAHYQKTRFTASGITTGPYPGTFRAAGHWTVNAPKLSVWRFGESFTIKSGTSTISGSINHGPPTIGGLSCQAFNRNDLRYKAGGGSGPATANIYEGYLSETLQ